MLLEMKCVFEAVYDESDFYYTYSYIQLYTQANFALKILSHNFQVHILNTSRVCVCERERKGLREMFDWYMESFFFFLVGKRQLPYLGERERFDWNMEFFFGLLKKDRITLLRERLLFIFSQTFSVLLLLLLLLLWSTVF